VSDRPAALPNGRTQARRIITAQVVVTALLAATFLVLDGTDSAAAALVGGLINVVANLYFARRLYGGARGRRIKSAIETVLGFYVGEVVKLFITLALFALALGVFKLSFLPLFGAFVATLLVFWLALAPGFNRLFGDRA
jgi:ATP synthase protein I